MKRKILEYNTIFENIKEAIKLYLEDSQETVEEPTDIHNQFLTL